MIDQAINYVKNNHLKACVKILTTDGNQLFLYQRDGNDQNDQWYINPIGYLNVSNICANYLIPVNTNVADTIASLTPAGVMRRIERP